MVGKIPDKLAEAYRPRFILACLGHVAGSKHLPGGEGGVNKGCGNGRVASNFDSDG